MYKLVLQIRWILLRFGFYFPSCGISGNVPWHMALWRPRYANGRTTLARTAYTRHLFFVNCQKSVVDFLRLWQFAQWLCDRWHISTTRAWYGNELETQSLQTSLDLENWLLHRWMCYTVLTIALRRWFLSRKKGFVTISLSLIYQSMVLSQPSSRDTVPLNMPGSYATTEDVPGSKHIVMN
jgi:hypothetical protein